MEFRLAVEADLEGQFAVFVAAQKELHDRRRSPWSAPTEFNPEGRWAMIHRHLLTHDGERSFVAEDEERIVGFTAAWVRDDTWYFSALFVEPTYQRRGVGRELLDLAWGGSHERRLTITEAIQPVSTGLYSRRGLLPLTPIVVLRGQPRIEAIEALEPNPADQKAMRALDGAAYGFDRSVDHVLWAAISDTATVWTRDGEPVAYSYRSSTGIGPVAGADPQSAGQALQAELARCVDREVTVAVPGSAPSLVETALESGLHLDDPGLLLTSGTAATLPSAVAIHSYWLF